VEVLGIDVDADALDQWRDWLMPEVQPFLVPRDVAASVTSPGSCALSRKAAAAVVMQKWARRHGWTPQEFCQQRGTWRAPLRWEAGPTASARSWARQALTEPPGRGYSASRSRRGSPQHHAREALMASPQRCWCGATSADWFSMQRLLSVTAGQCTSHRKGGCRRRRCSPSARRLSAHGLSGITWNAARCCPRHRIVRIYE
jgi:hypothetical protein